MPGPRGWRRSATTDVVRACDAATAQCVPVDYDAATERLEDDLNRSDRWRGGLGAAAGATGVIVAWRRWRREPMADRRQALDSMATPAAAAVVAALLLLLADLAYDLADQLLTLTPP